MSGAGSRCRGLIRAIMTLWFATIRTGNFCGPCSEVKSAIREISALIRVSTPPGHIPE
jgi:hypothetical protein